MENKQTLNLAEKFMSQQAEGVTTMENKDYLLIGGQNDTPEVFLTVEGESKYVGQPSVFLRLFGCTLTCKGFSSPSSPWGCDSYISWSKKNKRTFQEVGDLFERDFNRYLKDGAIFKITGGESLQRQEPLIRFIKYYRERFGFLPHIDFETNATPMPDPYWNTIGATFTTSPKLANNGDPEEKRYKPEVLQWHAQNWDHITQTGSIFKFVVSQKTDIDEIFEKYIDRFNIHKKSRVWFMPCCGNRQEHIERAPKIAEYCMEYGVNFSPRLHLLVWDMALLK